MPMDRGLYRRSILVNSNGKVLDTDTQTAALVIIENEHHHIHEGLAWTISGSVTLNAAENRDYVVLPENSDWLVHLRPKCYAEAEGSMSIYRAVNSTGGSAVTPECCNQDDPSNPRSTWKLNPTVTGTANLEYYEAFGANRVAGGADPAHERVLKRNTKYLVRFTSDASANEMNYVVFFYEHSINEDHT